MLSHAYREGSFYCISFVRKDSPESWPTGTVCQRICFNRRLQLAQEMQVRENKSPIVRAYVPLGPSPISITQNSGGGAEVGGWYNKVCGVCMCWRVFVCVPVFQPGGQKAKCNAASLRRLPGPALQSHDRRVQPAVFTSVGWLKPLKLISHPTFYCIQSAEQIWSDVFQIVRGFR